MFQWNQTYIVNSLPEEKYVKITHEGLGEAIRIPGATELIKSGIVEVRKSPYLASQDGAVSVTITPGTDAKELRRIKLYVKLSGSNNPYYSNALAFKGKPFVYEYKGNLDADKIAKLIQKINTLYNDPYLKVEANGSKVKFTGDNYTMFTEAVVEKFIPNASHINGGEWEVLETTVEFTAPVNGFGTYEQILKDLRLPTVENTGWTSTTDMPVPGAQYDQYTVIYKNKVGVQGSGHVGDLVEAQTTHAFYVNKSVTTFEDLFGEEITIITLNETPSKDPDEWTPEDESEE